MRKLGVLAMAFALAACTSTPKVAVRQPGDERMSCPELKAEFARLQAIQDEATRNKGLNPANVAAAVLFSPAMNRNAAEADEAEKLAAERRDHLMAIYAARNCTGS